MGSSFPIELKVGFTSLLAIALLFGGTLWVKKYNPMTKRVRITVLFDDARGIATGDPVNISGIKVGEVSNVDLDENNNALVEFSIKKDVHLRSNCVFTIEDVGLMGDKALVIIPGRGSEPLDFSKVYKGLPSSSLNDIIARADTVMQKLSSISTKIDNDIDIERLTSSFEQTFQKFREAITIYEEIAHDNREPLRKSLFNLETSANALKNFIQKNDKRFESALESFERTSDKISSALDNVDNLSTVIDTLSTYMKLGEGTLAKLVKSDDLYEELRRTNAHLDSFITDFKVNPGKYTKDMKFKIRLF